MSAGVLFLSCEIEQLDPSKVLGTQCDLFDLVDNLFITPLCCDI